MLFGVKKGLGEGEGSDDFLSSGAGAVHLKVSQSFPVQFEHQHQQDHWFGACDQTAVTCACCSCPHPAGASPCSNQPEAHKPCTPADEVLTLLTNWTNLVLYLLTGNVAALDTGSLVRTP